MRQQKKHIEQEAFWSRGIPAERSAGDGDKTIDEMKNDLYSRLKIEMLLCLSQHKKRAPEGERINQTNANRVE